MSTKKKHYTQAPPQPIAVDLPHLRCGKQWRAKDGLPKRRVEMYLGWLKELGMSDVDAQTMMSDLYWDCYAELKAAGVIPPETDINKLPKAPETT